jgi:uncharacterized membrane protein YgcG
MSDNKKENIEARNVIENERISIKEFFSRLLSKEHRVSTGIILFIAMLILFWVKESSFTSNLTAVIVNLIVCFAISWIVSKWLDINRVKTFKYFAIFWMSLQLILLKASDGNSSSYSSGNSGSYSNNTRSCSYCSRNFSGSGWETVSGEQYQPSSGDGIYCSRKCAYDAQPRKWKY